MCVLVPFLADGHVTGMSTNIRIDVWTDPVCPWCLIGAVRLGKAVDKLRDDIVVEIANHPFYLDPDTPLEGYDVAEMLRQRYGRDPQEIWARAEAEARNSGIELDLSRQPRMYPTRKAHTLVRLAAAKGTQHPLANAIAWAYFMEHREINDDAVLAGIAESYGYGQDEALAVMQDPKALAETQDLAAAAAQQGIRGVPFFVFDNRFALSGAQPEDVFERALRIATGEEQLPS